MLEQAFARSLLRRLAPVLAGALFACGDEADGSEPVTTVAPTRPGPAGMNQETSPASRAPRGVGSAPVLVPPVATTRPPPTPAPARRAPAWPPPVAEPVPLPLTPASSDVDAGGETQ